MNQSVNATTGNLIQMESKHCYCLVFPNYKKLDLSTIEDIFSNYGRVISVTAAGNERGYRFVRYPTVEEAQRAVDNVANDYDIHLKCHKPKNQLERQSKSYKKYLRSDDYKREFGLGEFKKPSTPVWKQQERRENPVDEFKKPSIPVWENEQQETPVDEFKKPSIPVWEYELQENHSDYSSDSSDEGKDKPLYFIQKPHSINNSLVSDSSGQLTSESSGQLRSSISEEMMNQQYNDLSESSGQLRSESSGQLRSESSGQLRSESTGQLRPSINEERMNQRYNELQNLRQEIFTPSDSESLPDLVSSKNPEKQRIVLTAGEVVVGNIPTVLGAAFLLHLFDRHHPIAISYLQPVPRANSKYCHVYFRSDKDALQVEREFDQFDLMGRRLIVMRPEKLVRFAAK